MGHTQASRSTAPVWRIRRFETIDSTNRFALGEARAGADEGLVVVADHQDAGRGRRGRSWTAPPGSSLLVSVLLRPTIDAECLHLVAMATAVALADAVHDVAGLSPSLKWPNDLVVRDRKLAGLLAEADVSADGTVRAVVVGAGCNVQWPELPPELAATATTCEAEAGHAVDRGALLAAFLDRLAARYAALDGVPDEYRNRLSTLGRRVRVELSDRTYEGTALDVDDHGRLVLAPDDGDAMRIAVGDVVHLRPAAH